MKKETTKKTTVRKDVKKEVKEKKLSKTWLGIVAFREKYGVGKINDLKAVLK